MNKKGFIELDEFNLAAAGMAVVSIPLVLWILSFYPANGILIKILTVILTPIASYFVCAKIFES